MKIWIKSAALLFILFLTGCDLFIESQENDWTLFIYSSGDNDGLRDYNGNLVNNLDELIYQDFQEMENARFGSNLKVILLIDRTSDTIIADPDHWDDTRLYEIRYDGDSDQIGSQELESAELGLTVGGLEELDLSDSAILASFIAWGKSAYPADYYGIIFEGHGDGWYSEPAILPRTASGVIYDYQYLDDTNTEQFGYDVLTTAQIGDVLRADSVSFVGFDACLMGNAETLYDLKEGVDYVVANPWLVPGDGNYYTYLLEELADSSKNPFSFSMGYLRAYRNAYSARTYSAYDLDRLMVYYIPGLSSLIESETWQSWNSAIMDYYNGSYPYSSNLDNSDYRNLAVLWEGISPGSSKERLGEVSIGLVPGTYHLGVYLPSSSNYIDDRTDYKLLSYSQVTNWDELLDDSFGISP